MSIFRRHLSLASSLFRKYDLDYSKVPKIDEKDIQERFVRGSGPGGQAVAKTNNCVVLTHIPTGKWTSVLIFRGGFGLLLLRGPTYISIDTYLRIY